MNDNRSLLVFKELKNLGVKVSKVKRLKCAHPKQKSVSSKTAKGIFGVNLCDQEWIPVGEVYLPRFLVLVTTFLQSYIGELGLFRKAGSVSRQRKLKEKLNGGSSLEDAGPHDAAALLKQWLRELPEPLLPSSLQDIFLKCLQLESADHQATGCLLTCLLLPTDRLQTLKHLLQFLASVAACSDMNKMELYNVSAVLAPTIFNCEVNKLNAATQFIPVMQHLIRNADKVGDLGMLPATSQDIKSSSELQCPAEFLACSPKRKSVHDVLNGFKKFVGQGGLVSPSKIRLPPESPVRRNSSSSKRKGDNVTPLTPAKKSKEESHFSTTPKSKAFSNKDGKGKTNQSRHKTFDLLRRRTKNKQKNPATPILKSTANFYDATPSILVTDENGTSSSFHSKLKGSAEAEVPHSTPFVPSLRFSFEKTINLDSNSVTTSSTSDISEMDKISLKVASKSESSVEPVTPLIEVIRMPEPEDSVPTTNKAGVTRTPSAASRNKNSSRKQGTISRQEAFIFRRDSSVSKSDHVIQLAKKNTTTNTNKSSRHKFHKTMPLNKSTPSTKQVRSKNSITNLKRNATITSSLDFHPRNIEKIDFKEIDCALTFDFEKLVLEEVTSEEEEDPVFELPVIHAELVGTPEYVKGTPNQQATTNQDTKNKTLQSNKKLLPTTQPRTPVSKIPRLSSTGSISQVHSELRRNSKVRRSAGSNANFTPFKSPGLSDMNASANPGLDASCCRTPGALCSPGSDSPIHWISAAKFLSAETPKDAAVPNKRESIAMILRNKGHVKDKISMYNVQVRQSMHASRSCSTPIENNSPKTKPHSDRPKKRDLAVTKSCDLSRRPRHRTQRPSPLPKFVMPDNDTPPKQSLQQSASTSRSIHSIQEENDPSEVASSSLNFIVIKEEDVLKDLSGHVHQGKNATNIKGLSNQGQGASNITVSSNQGQGASNITVSSNQGQDAANIKVSSNQGQDAANIKGLSNKNQNAANIKDLSKDHEQTSGDLSGKLLSLCDQVHKMGLQDSTNLGSKIDSPVKDSWCASPDMKTRSRNATPVKDKFYIFQDLDENSILSPMKENLVLSPVNANLLSPVWKQKRQNRKSKEKRHSSFSGAPVMHRGGRRVLRSKSSPGKKIRVYKIKPLKENRRLVPAV